MNRRCYVDYIGQVWNFTFEDARPRQLLQTYKILSEIIKVYEQSSIYYIDKLQFDSV